MVAAARPDILVVGGGPAGLAVAIAARARGFRVTVADQSLPPADKACGEGLMPQGRRALEQFGVHVDAGKYHPFRGVRFVEGGVAVQADFPEGLALGIRRTVLHAAMVQRAEAVGVSLLWGNRVEALAPGRAVVGGRAMTYGWVAGADGTNSHVRRWAGLDATVSVKRRFGFRRHYAIAPWSDFMELYWCRGYQIYVTPVSPREVCVAVLSEHRGLRMDDALRGCRELSTRLCGIRETTVERGAITVSCRLKRVYNGRVVLVGDASGSVDAVTGEGLHLAFEHALVLAECLERGGLEDYQARHRRIARRSALMAELMLAIGHRERLRARVLRAMSAEPDILARMLAVHVGSLAPRHLARNTLSLGWRMLTA